MNLADDLFLKRCHRLALASRRLRGASLFGRRRTGLPVGGTEMTGHRDYSPGDDPRYIDWNACARHDELFSRCFEGTVDRQVYLLIDCSVSMAGGEPSKFDLARQLAAALGYIALDDLELVGASAMVGDLVADFAPCRGRSRAVRLLRFLQDLSLRDGPTNLAGAAERFVRRDQRRGPVVVMSDFYDAQGFEPALNILQGGGYRPAVVQFGDPPEAMPRQLGDLEISAREVSVHESGTRQKVVLTERHLAVYRQVHEEFHESLRTYCNRHRLRRAAISSGMSMEDALWEVVGSGHEIG